MRFKGFIGPSYTLQSKLADCQRTINFYLEANETGTAAEGDIACLVATPGLTLLVTLPTSPCRGIYCDSKGNLWAVAGNKAYLLDSNYVATEIGTLSSNVGPVDFSDNGTQAVMVDGNYGYSWTMADGSNFSQIADAAFYGSNRVAFLDGYFVYNKPRTNVFYLGPINAVTPFDGLDFGSAEAGPDPIIGHVVMQQNLYLLSKNHLEVWYDAGSDNFPFQRIQGSVIEIGCEACFSIQSIQSSVYWLGRDKTGGRTVYRMSGLVPQRISTLAIETKLRELGDCSTARAWTYQQSGHIFYCLNLPGANTTWVYDITTGLWHERAFFSSVHGYSRHLVDAHAYYNNTNIGIDYASGNIYKIDFQNYTDNNNYISRERVCPHIAASMKRLFYKSFQLDMEMGLGLDGSGQGSDPQVMISWSNDGGYTFSNEITASVSKLGARRARAYFQRLGWARDRVFRLRMTDPIKITWLGAEIEVEQGMS